MADGSESSGTIHICERIPSILMYILQISMEIWGLEESKSASPIRWPRQMAWKNVHFQRCPVTFCSYFYLKMMVIWMFINEYRVDQANYYAGRKPLRLKLRICPVNFLL